MALNFPSSPTLNQIYTVDNVRYQYDGVRWKPYTVDYNYQGATVPISNSTAVVDLNQGNLFDLTAENTTISGSLSVQFANNASEAQTFKLKVTADPSFSSVFNIQNASYDNSSFSVAAQENGPMAVIFKPDGTKMYIMGFQNSTVYQYTLSTPWDLSTVSYDSVSFSVASQALNPRGLFFKPDGTKMYMVSIASNPSFVFQYTLSTPWAVNTATYDSVSFSYTGQDPFSSVYDISFKPDGTKMYLLSLGTDVVLQYTLSTPWAVNTASYDSVVFSVAAQDTTPTGIFFKPDGTKMFMIGQISDNVYQYTLSTPWAVDSASYDNVSFSVATQENEPLALSFKPDGTKMYIVGSANDTVYQYSLQDALTIQWPTNILWEDILVTPAPPADGENKTYIFTTSDGGNKYFGTVYE